MVDKGVVMLQNYLKRDNKEVIGYYVIPKFSRTLNNEKLNIVQILDVISDLLDLVQKLH